MSGLFHPRGTRAGLRRRTSNIKIISTNIQAGDRRVCSTSVIPKGINGNNVIPINCISEPLNHRGKPLKFVFLSARSVCKPFKSLLVNDYIVDHDIDLCVITERSLHGDNSDEFYCREICPEGYRIDHIPKTYAQGRGVAVVYKRSLKIRRNVQTSFTSFELLDISIILTRNQNLRLAAI